MERGEEKSSEKRSGGVKERQVLGREPDGLTVKLTS